MRILFDVLGAPAQSGGMRSHAEQLIWAWSEAFPDDEIVVAGGAWITESFKSSPTLDVVVLPASSLQRILSQWWRVARLGRQRQVDAVHSVSPVVTPFAARSQCASNTLHDWRHRLRPSEFGRPQRLYRRTWSWASRHADLSVQISAKTAAESARFAAGATQLLAPSGTDQARRWAATGSADSDPNPVTSIVTFGHHTNKRPDLVVAAMTGVVPHFPRAALTVLGARGALRAQVRAQADRLGLAEHVSTPGFVDEATYQSLIRAADAVVMASSDEGFGFPVAEAAYFGIPVVATDDNGLRDIHSYPIHSAVPTAEAVGAALMTALTSDPPSPGPSGATWAETAQLLREAIGHVSHSVVPGRAE